MTHPKKLRSSSVKPLKAKAYEPTEAEQKSLEAQRQRRLHRDLAPRISVDTKDQTGKVSFDHADQGVAGTLLLEALATSDIDFLNGILSQVINAGTQGKTPSEQPINFMLSVIKGIEPRDQLETMLALQMAAVHNATMTFARRLAHVDNIAQQDSAERAFNKLARTFAVQIEALKRYRSKGEQRMVVQHQHLNVAANNAQVNVNTDGGGGTSNFSEDQPLEPKPEHLGHEPGTAMPGEIEAIQAALPSTGGKGA